MSSTQVKTGPEEVNGNTTTKRGTESHQSPVLHPPSPGVDVHALFGIPRAKRPSEKSEEQEDLEDSDTDDLIDSDDDEFEEFQEGEYLVIEDSEDFQEMQAKLMEEQADLHRQILLPVFKACTTAYDKWVAENKDTVPETEMADRRAQLQLYRKVLELYGSDEDWAKLAHEQKISTDKEVLETSERAKDMGTPPDVVSEASIAAGKSVADDTLSAENVTRMVEDRMQKLDL